MKIMKRIASKIFLSSVVATMLIVLFVSCNKNIKDTQPPPESKVVRLSASYTNDTLREKFYYGANKKIQKYEYYGSDGSIALTRTYEYNNEGNITKRFIGNSYSLYDVNTSAQITRIRYYDAAENFDYSRKYEYNPSGKKQLVRDATVTPIGNEQSFRLFTYPGNLQIEEKGYSISAAGAEVLGYKVNYLLADEAGQELIFNDLHQSMSLPGVNEGIAEIAGRQIEYFIYNAVGAVSSHSKYIMSNRIYNSKGYVTSQSITYLKLIPAAPLSIKKIRYEYIDL